jgi:molecular chaperone GrpE
VPPTPPPAGEELAQDIATLLSEAERERDEYLELAKRTKADFENFRKRMTAEIQAAARRGKAELALGLIDAVDNLERALEAQAIDPAADPLDAGPTDQPEIDAFAHGVVLVLNGMRETLRSNGVEALDPSGEPFDPQWHEALSTQAAVGAEPGTVIEVVQKGYRFGEHLVRPARVVVAE